MFIIKFIKKNLYIISIIIIYILIIISLIYFIFLAEPYSIKPSDKYPNADDGNELVYKQNIVYNPLIFKEKLISIYENSRLYTFKDNFITVIRDESKFTNSLKKSYIIENLSSGINYRNIKDESRRTKISNYKTVYKDKMLNAVYQYNTNSLLYKESNYNYIDFIQYHTDKDVFRNCLLEKTKNDIEILNLFAKENKFILFYIVKSKPESRKLTGNKILYMKEFYNLKEDGNCSINTKEIMMPHNQRAEYSRLYELSIIKEEKEEEYTAIYRANLRRNDNEIEIFISKMDKEANVYYTTNLPLHLPEGIFDDFRVDTDGNHNYILCFSSTDLRENASTPYALLFDREGNPADRPFIYLDPDKPLDIVARDFHIIHRDGLYFIFFKYDDYAYYLTIINKTGKIMLSPSVLKEINTNVNPDETLAVALYKDIIIARFTNEIAVYQLTEDNTLNTNKYNIVNSRLIHKAKTNPALQTYEKGIALIWQTEGNITHTGLLELDEILSGVNNKEKNIQ